jgi:hypothetical protein
MKEEWLFPGAIVSVDVETTSALVAEIKRLIDVVGGMALGMALAQPEQKPICPDCKAAVLYECVACSSNNYPPQKQAEPVAYDKTEMNGFVQDLYDRKMQEGKHGHYETMFHVVHQAIKRAAPPQRHPLTDEDWEHIDNKKGTALDTFAQGAVWAADQLKEKNT